MTYRGNNEFFFLSRGQYNRIAQIILNNAKEKTMTDTKHTPTPWNVSQTGSYFTEIRAESGRRIAETWVQGQARSRDAAIKQAYTNEANAAHIVKCVNLHDELVEALKNLHIAALQSTVNSLSNDYGSDALSESYALLKKAGAL